MDPHPRTQRDMKHTIHSSRSLILHSKPNKPPALVICFLFLTLFNCLDHGDAHGWSISPSFIQLFSRSSNSHASMLRFNKHMRERSPIDSVAAGVIEIPRDSASQLPIIPVEYGLSHSKVTSQPAMVPSDNVERSADDDILSIRLIAVRHRIQTALREIYLRVASAREEMLKAVKVSTGGGKWADDMLHSVADARVNTNKAVAFVENANSIVTQLNDRTDDSRRITSGLLQVHDLVLLGWKWIAVAELDCKDGSKAARDRASHSGKLIHQAQIKASGHLSEASKHLKGAGASCWGSLGDAKAKEEVAASRERLREGIFMPENARNVSNSILHSIAEQKLLPFSAGAGSLHGKERDLRRVVRYQEHEMSWTPCFQDLCKSQSPIERSGCMWGCMALISPDHTGLGAENFAGFCAAHATEVLLHTGESDLIQVVEATTKSNTSALPSAAQQTSMSEIESSWAKSCRQTSEKRKKNPNAWGVHGGVTDGTKPSVISVEEEDNGTLSNGGGLERVQGNVSSVPKANLRAGDRWAECDEDVCGKLEHTGLSRSGCLHGCRTAILGGVQRVSDCAMWCEETVDQVLADPENLGVEATSDLPSGLSADDKRARWISTCHVGCKSILERINKGEILS